MVMLQWVLRLVERTNLCGSTRPHRHSSIFNEPIRAILDEPEYEVANDASKRLSGKGLNRQTFAIIPKISEVDQVLASSAKAQKFQKRILRAGYGDA